LVNDLRLLSAYRLFSSSNWLEREVWDLNGVFFEKHPDLRRILTDYGFEGYPLRKDFPLSGFIGNSQYSNKKHMVIFEKMCLPQKFRPVGRPFFR
jgi:NADH:ubiquinone oxidoreductase subunit C